MESRLAHKQLVSQQTAQGTQHTYSEEEKTAFVEYINTRLSQDPDLAGIVPVNSAGTDIFKAVRNGLLLCKMINDAKANTIDERALNRQPKMNVWQIQENQNLMLNSAKAIGCVTVNIGATDLIEGVPHLTLGLIWQIVRIGLTAKINLVDHPELFRLLNEGESLDDFRKQNPEQILLRWFNYHLKNANHNRRVSNFTTDVQDSVNYTVLLHQIAPQLCDTAALQEGDLEARADMVLANSEKLGCKRFISPKDIVAGNHKLNLSFVATLFNNWPGLAPPEKEDLEKWKVLIEEDNSSDSREERAFRNWINNCGIDGQIENLFTDLQDGHIVLQVIDKLRPGIVEWKKVNKPPIKLIFKKNENTNYAVNLAKQVGCKVVGFDGQNISAGHRLYTLALVWQLMRADVLQTLQKLSQTPGKEITESQLVEMANQKVAASGKQTRISSFQDPLVRNGHFLIDLVAACEPRAIDYTLVKPGDTPEEKALNAKYAIAAARKMGCAIFAIWDDIVQGNTKLVMTFVGTVLAYRPQ